MPHSKIKSFRKTKRKSAKKAPILCTEKGNDLSTNIEANPEPRGYTELNPNKSPDLSKFKLKKRPHVKIQFERESPVNEESKGVWEPMNWRTFLLNLRNMRAKNNAPFDPMGCHMSMDENTPPEVYRYQCLISLMLSSQTTDQVTFAAMERLRARGLTINNILDITNEELGKLICPVEFWKTKVKYIKKTTQTLKEQYNGDIPDSVDKLCTLSGVGPTMAHICMLVAWNNVTEIGVDPHVHRISNRIGWVKKRTSNPEDTRKSLQSWLPEDLWSEVNQLLVGFGQTICLPMTPMCHECPNNDICPSSSLGISPKNLKKETEKHALGFEIDGSEKSPSKRKITPRKKKLEVEALGNEIVENSNLLYSGAKIAVGESSKTINSKESDLDNFVDKSEAAIIKVRPKRRTRMRKSISAKLKEKEINSVLDSVEPNNEAAVLQVKTKKAPQKRKIQPKKDENAEKGLDLNDFQTIKNTVVTGTKTQKHFVDEAETTVVQAPKKSPVKLKSPKIKTIDAGNEKGSKATSGNKKKKKATKK